MNFGITVSLDIVYREKMLLSLSLSLPLPLALFFGSSGFLVVIVRIFCKCFLFLYNLPKLFIILYETRTIAWFGLRLSVAWCGLKHYIRSFLLYILLLSNLSTSNCCFCALNHVFFWLCINFIYTFRWFVSSRFILLGCILIYFDQ